MRVGSTKCTPMAPVSGPLTHGVAATKPSASATLRSVKRAVALRTVCTSGAAAEAARGTLSTSAASSQRGFSFFMLVMVFSVTGSAPGLLVEIRIQHPHLGDALHRQLAAAGGVADRLGCRGVVDTKGLLLVGAYVRVDPGDLVLEVALNNCQAGLGSRGVHGNLQPVRELSLDDITRHGLTPGGPGPGPWSGTIGWPRGAEIGRHP